MKTETIDINKRPEMENFIENSEEAKNEINKTVIRIICHILSDKGEITYEEKRNIINNAVARVIN